MSVDLRRNPWNRKIPEYFNIGSACSDVPPDSPVADQVAMIVEDDALGTAMMDPLFQGKTLVVHERGHPIRLGSAGRIQPGHAVALLDENRRPVPVGKEGMICVAESDPGLFLGYWNQQDETRTVCHHGWFFTGDYARKDEDGYIWFLGRRDDIINTFGYRVSHQEVERVMKTHPDVSDCVAIGQEIEVEKTLVALCVILESGSQSGTKELLDFGELHLASYKCPRLVNIMEDFPRTRNGKVLRGRIKQEIEHTSNDMRKQPNRKKKDD